MGDLPDYVDDPAATPTTLREPGRYRCRCTYLHPNGGALWEHLDGAGHVWTAVEEDVAVGVECFISIRPHHKPLLWLFPAPPDPGPATLPEGYVRFVPRPWPQHAPVAERPPF